MGSKVDLWPFQSMYWVSSILTDDKLRWLWTKWDELINWKKICDLWAGVTSFMSHILDQWFEPDSVLEVDPIFSSKEMFESNKVSSVTYLREVLNGYHTKVENTRSEIEDVNSYLSGEKWLLSDEERRSLIEANKRYEQLIAYFEWLISNMVEYISRIERNRYTTSSSISRQDALFSDGDKLDTVFMTKVFYASQEPRKLLFGLSKVLSSNGNIIIIDHLGEKNITRLLRVMDKTNQDIEVLINEDNDGWGELFKNQSIISIRLGLNWINSIRKKLTR